MSGRAHAVHTSERIRGQRRAGSDGALVRRPASGLAEIPLGWETYRRRSYWLSLVRMDDRCSRPLGHMGCGGDRGRALSGWGP